MFKKFLTTKATVASSDFLCYTVDGKKTDEKIHTHILEKGVSEKYKSLSVARLRARTGGDLEFIASLVS